MSRNTLLAFVLSMAVLIIWMMVVRKNYQVPSETNPPVFEGIKNISFDETTGTLKLSWDPAKDESEVAYLIYYSPYNKITNFDKPAYYTKNTYFEINDLDFQIPYYFAVRAVDYFNNISTNIKQVLFKPRKISKVKETLIAVETPLAKYILSTLGARIKYIILKKYKNITDNSNVKLVIYPDKKFAKYYPLDFVILKSGDENFIKNDFNIYKYNKSKTNIVFTGTINNIEITKEYTFHNNKYEIEHNITLKYKGRNIEEYKGSTLVLKWQPYLGPIDEQSRYNILETAYFNNAKLNKIKYAGGGLFSRKYNYYGKVITRKEENIEYITFHNRYFVSAIIPMERYKVNKAFFYSDGNIYISGIGSRLTESFFKKGEITYNYLIYAGPKLRDTFRAEKLLNSLEKTIKFRKLISPIGNLFLDILRFFYKIVHNWGLSIILFTLLIKLVLYPLTHKQFESMARMQKIQPIIAQVREQYKSDPQKMNQELMRIYKKYRVNPFGGCLPLLFQIPVFLAIWDMLQYSLELRDASFLWIRSLALPDTVGYLAGIPLNPLPAIMGVSMFIQQKLTSTDPQHKFTMMLMPFIFLILFWNMPSGLVLYWTLQNILSIFQQIYLTKKMKNISLKPTSGNKL